MMSLQSINNVYELPEEVCDVLFYAVFWVFTLDMVDILWKKIQFLRDTMKLFWSGLSKHNSRFVINKDQ